MSEYYGLPQLYGKYILCFINNINLLFFLVDNMDKQFIILKKIKKSIAVGAASQ